jgi:Icc-related predicted phosphoesterase
MRLVLLSDTHGLHDHLLVPDGDVLIHAGDFTLHGDLAEVQKFDNFLATMPHAHKLVIAGNHDFCFENNPEEARKLLGNALYLEDSGCEIDGYNFWGSPWQPWFMDMAFNLDSETARGKKWKAIPAATDVLITHTPPRGILDLTSLGEQVGCSALAQELRSRDLLVHVFGHIHEAYGVYHHDATTYVNACNCTLQYLPHQPPLVVDI